MFASCDLAPALFSAPEPLCAQEDAPIERVLIAKADRMLAAALEGAVRATLPHAMIDAVGRIDEATHLLGVRKYQLVVSGIMLVDGDALDWLAGILRTPDSPRVMVVTGRRETRVLAALHESRAHGVFDSYECGPDEFRSALQLVLSGGIFWSGSVRTALWAETRSGSDLLRSLTATEQLVLAVIGDGADDTEAADRLEMTSVAVRSHRKRIYAKLCINHRGQLIRLALCHGFVRVSGERVVQPGLGLLRSRVPRRPRAALPGSRTA